MSFQVEISPAAERDISSIEAWIYARSETGAAAWWQALQKMVQRLETNADSCGLAAEAAVFSEPVYQVLFKTRKGRNYHALFVLRNNTVHIVSV